MKLQSGDKNSVARAVVADSNSEEKQKKPKYQKIKYNCLLKI